MSWIPCNNCENYWCTEHQQHAHDCPCPPLEEWGPDPYKPGAKLSANHYQTED